MFNEIIYTRCGRGIDLAKNGQTIQGEGFKVYSASKELFTDGSVEDMNFLAGCMQAKQSYSDPEFMDSAYSYYVPDTGKPYLVCFQPVIFDDTLQGSFSNRPGLFINQAYIGDYSALYPCELFGSKSLWDAKEKGTAYYYETFSNTLPQREITGSGTISFEAAGAFIAQGRAELLKKAVAFLINQYKLPAEKRKFLVIKDEDSSKIELWTAAIEYAFSPELASTIPFATRLNKFAETNRYTVDGSGKACSQINLQDPGQKIHWRAMIAGVDARDKANVSAARELPNSPFVLLDGGTMQTGIKDDCSGTYFDLISSFNDNHKEFCQAFLPSFGNGRIDESIQSLCSLWQSLSGIEKLSPSETAGLLQKLPECRKADSSWTKKLSDKLIELLPEYIKSDIVSSFLIARQLKAFAHADRKDINNEINQAFQNSPLPLESISEDLVKSACSADLNTGEHLLMLAPAADDPQKLSEFRAAYVLALVKHAIRQPKSITGFIQLLSDPGISMAAELRQNMVKAVSEAGLSGKDAGNIINALDASLKEILKSIFAKAGLKVELPQKKESAGFFRSILNFFTSGKNN